jgi:methylmalonyl-CoA mutase cobalamin-binding domain/chain
LKFYERKGGSEMAEDLSALMVELKKEEVLEEVKSRVAAGEDVVKIIEDCRHGMVIVGENFQKGDSFLAELMLVGEIFKAAMGILGPRLDKDGLDEKNGRVIMATMQGDIHDLGKNIVVNLLKAHGFEVFDLGVDVRPEVLVAKAKETKPDFIGFSSLLTTTLPVMKKTVQMLADEGLRDSVKIMIGGGVSTPGSKEFIGADFQTLDALEGVNYCIKSIGGR